MKTSSESFEFSVIGKVSTPFADKFGVPRQPGLVNEARGMIQLNADPDLVTALKSLEEFSHLWIVFVFHEHGGKNWKPSIRPPRLGGKQKVGVLASRSPHRPNPIGLSAVQIEKIILDAPNGPQIHVLGVDLIDGTPVLDIKPYIPYADSIPQAKAGWASDPIPRYAMSWSDEAQIKLAALEDSEIFKKLVESIIELDPRPAYQKKKYPVDFPQSQGLQFGMNIQGFDIKYKIEDEAFVVYDLALISK